MLNNWMVDIRNNPTLLQVSKMFEDVCCLSLTCMNYLPIWDYSNIIGCICHNHIFIFNYMTCHLLDVFTKSDLHTLNTVGNPHRSNLG